MSIQTAGQALGLQKHQLLQAGPPLRDARQPPAVLRSSIVMTCLHEGRASTEADAEALLRDGVLQLQPAQPLGCVTPLAAMVAPGTPLAQVVDGAANAQPSGLSLYAPVSTVRGPDTRMGMRDAGLLTRLQQRDDDLVPDLQQHLARHGPIDLWALGCAGLAAGDDLHSRTTGANAALVQALRAPGDAQLADDIAGKPADVVRAGAIGDSAVIDMLGLGGQRMARAPEPLSVFGPLLPAGAAEAVLALLARPHPGLPQTWPVGIDAAQVLAQARPPLVVLAMLAQDGLQGLLGRGIYQPPLGLFAQALQAGGRWPLRQGSENAPTPQETP
ncbi:MAG: DUF1116 domain-containing protein [Aquabacterium sp.]|nr:DUF1116 domain-containing protein [Aquabacterium sp.]